MSVTSGSDDAGDRAAARLAERGGAGWRAGWCWTALRCPRPWNTYVYFRLAVTLPGKPTAAALRVSADARYTLYANGRRVHQGPARCRPGAQGYDELDLTDVLTGGPNVLCAVVHQFGVPTAQSAYRDASGFLLDGSAEVDGEVVDLHTPGQWVCREAKGWRKNVERLNADLGFQEHFDADADPVDWMSADYAATEAEGWRAPVVVAPAGGFPWVTMAPRGVPLLADQVASFRDIVAQFTGETARGHKVAEDVYRLAAQEARRKAKAPIENLEAILVDDGQGAVIAPPGDGQFHAAVLDLGRVRVGHLILDILDAAGDEIIDVIYTARLDKTQGPPADGDDAGGLADRYRCRPGAQRWEPFFAKGFRYATLVFRSVEKPLRIRYVGVRTVGAAVEQVGTFGCGDATLTAVYRAGAATLRACMVDAYADAADGGQAQRWPDVLRQLLAGAACFTDGTLAERAIRMAAASQAADGSLHACPPADEPAARRVEGMLAWVDALAANAAHTGRADLLTQCRPALDRLLAFFAAHECLDGLVGGFERFTVGHAGAAGPGAVENMLYLRALRGAAAAYAVLADEGAAARITARAAALSAVIEKHFWDAKGKTWRDAVGADGAPADGQSVRANALAVTLGLGAADARVGVARYVVLKAMLAKRGKVPPAAPADAGDVLDALAGAGLRTEAVDLIKARWGPMTEGPDDDGGATLWETWDGAGGSRCYGAACAPIATLVELVLGVNRAAPGWRRVRVAPLVGAIEFAKGSVPTPLGLVRVEWEKAGDDQLAVRVELPDGMEGEFIGPLGVTRALEAGASEFQT